MLANALSLSLATPHAPVLAHIRERGYINKRESNEKQHNAIRAGPFQTKVLASNYQ